MHGWCVRHGAWCAQVVGYPSKSAALVLGDAGARGGVEPVLILRSDSNVEDLAGHARSVLCGALGQLRCARPAINAMYVLFLSADCLDKLPAACGHVI